MPVTMDTVDTNAGGLPPLREASLPSLVREHNERAAIFVDTFTKSVKFYEERLAKADNAKDRAKYKRQLQRAQTGLATAKRLAIAVAI